MKSILVAVILFGSASVYAASACEVYIDNCNNPKSTIVSCNVGVTDIPQIEHYTTTMNILKKMADHGYDFKIRNVGTSIKCLETLIFVKM